ncbi:elongation factor P--(R)-beta-lysine ligase [Buchnera aphidicola (Mindarus keteleerifoliae)]|uniref:elongation factor P--(R)-beta-lysine ligase n=1 Tax=Buchnera aphidicola TaxID=9 RepID=UPI0031B6C3D2
MPTASIETLIKRSLIITKIRRFLSKLSVLEVETPILNKYPITDPNIVQFNTTYCSSNKKKKTNFWLNTSPEYHMKRLLAAGIGPIYQICHSFRNEEKGIFHNPEFTILEWYQPGYSMHDLIKEVTKLLKLIFKCKKVDVISYQKIFLKYLKIDPLSISIKKLKNLVKELGISNLVFLTKNFNNLLEVLFMEEIEPKIGKKNPICIYHFPSAQASLSEINPDDYRVSERFEFFFKGVEIGNGFYELKDVNEQKKRFLMDNKKRKELGLEEHPLDLDFLNSLDKGNFPKCSGIAIGIDRLVMLSLNLKEIRKAMSFSLDV